MKKLFTFFLVSFFTNLTIAQIPTGYYDGTAGLTGYALKTQLSTIISNGALDLGYGSGTGGLWTTYFTSDVDKYYENDGTLLDMYSEIPSGTDSYEYNLGQVSSGGNQCGNGSNHENSCYNREHSLPKTYFGGINAIPMANDAHFVIPTDYYVNSKRSNYPYGETSSPTWTSTNGTKLGTCTFPGYSGVIFEPINEFKGDLARMQLYFVTRYESKLSSFTAFQTSSSPLDGSTDKGFQQWYINLMLKWAAQDPVSQKEIDRNNAIYARQNNRNPFIDHPEWVAQIWTSTLATNEITNNTNAIAVYPNPVKNNELFVKGIDLNHVKNLSIFSADGKLMQSVKETSKTSSKILLNKLPKGVYLLKVDKQSLKFIVE